MFRHHATIGSLRAIWRPRLRGPLSSSSTPSSHNSDQQQNELIHMIKGVSRSGGAAFNKITGSIPWITTENKRQQFQSPTSFSPTTTSSLDPAESPSHIPILDDTSRISSVIPARKPSPLSIQTGISSAEDSDSEASIAPGISPGHLDQDIPSYVQAAPSLDTSLIPVAKPRLRISKSSDTNNQHFMHKEQGDFVPFIHVKKASRHTRSVSDSILFDPAFTAESGAMVDSLRVDFQNYQAPVSRKRSLSSIHGQPERPKVMMNVQTYMSYEKLVQQQRLLQQTYLEMKQLADEYESTAMSLKETYEQRSKEFQMIQDESRGVMEEQNLTERRLKDVEDNSAKSHYELKVLNDKLKDIEDNVGAFYGKVGLLERKMDDSQHSITTMLIIGNYLNHYWVKVREWVRWLNSEDTMPPVVEN